MYRRSLIIIKYVYINMTSGVCVCVCVYYEESNEYNTYIANAQFIYYGKRGVFGRMVEWHGHSLTLSLTGINAFSITRAAMMIMPPRTSPRTSTKTTQGTPFVMFSFARFLIYVYVCVYI